MPAFFKIHFGDKSAINYFLCLSSSLGSPSSPLTYCVLDSVNTFGAYSTKVNEEQIRKQAVSYLSRLSSEQAYRYEEYFSKGSSMLALSPEINVNDASSFGLQITHNMKTKQLVGTL